MRPALPLSLNNILVFHFMSSIPFFLEEITSSTQLALLGQKTKVVESKDEPGFDLREGRSINQKKVW